MTTVTGRHDGGELFLAHSPTGRRKSPLLFMLAYGAGRRNMSEHLLGQQVYCTLEYNLSDIENRIAAQLGASVEVVHDSISYRIAQPMNITTVKYKKNRETVIVDATKAVRKDRTFTVVTPRNELGVAEYRESRFGGAM